MSVLPQDLLQQIEDLRLGPSGEGPHAFNWSDKPHRLVYDALELVAKAYERGCQSCCTWRPMDDPQLEKFKDEGSVILYFSDTLRAGESTVICYWGLWGSADQYEWIAVSGQPMKREPTRWMPAPQPPKEG